MCNWSLVRNLIRQIITQQELQKLIKCLPKGIRDIHKIKKTNSMGIHVFGYEEKDKCSICS